MTNLLFVVWLLLYPVSVAVAHRFGGFLYLMPARFHRHQRARAASDIAELAAYFIVAALLFGK